MDMIPWHIALWTVFDILIMNKKTNPKHFPYLENANIDWVIWKAEEHIRSAYIIALLSIGLCKQVNSEISYSLAWSVWSCIHNIEAISLWANCTILPEVMGNHISGIRTFLLGLQFWGIACLVIVPISVTSQKSNFSHISIDDGLAHNNVNAIVKDHDGFMWFGTRNGLCKYDGYDFRTFTTSEDRSTSLPVNRIETLFVDKNYLYSN